MKWRDTNMMNNMWIETSVEEVRQILWPKYNALSDVEVQWIIILFSSFAKLTIAEHLADKREQMKKSIQSKSW